MDGKSFPEVVDINFFRNKKILIDEQLLQCCDFLLIEFVRHLNYSIFHYNNDKKHFESILQGFNLQGRIYTVYDEKWENQDIVDDVYTARTVHGVHEGSKVNVFRSGTAAEENYYDYDVIIRVEPLKSGCTSSLDGVIAIFSRDIEHYHLKYKIFPTHVHYYI